MSLLNYAQRVVVRRLTLLALGALLAWLGFGEVKAQTLTAAYASCQAYVADANSRCLGFVGGVGQPYTGSCTVTATNVQFNCHYNDGRVSNNRFRWSHSGCAAGLTWHDVLKQCVGACPAGAIRMTNGKCSPTPEQCENFNDSAGFKGVGSQVLNFGSVCRSGCVYAAGESAATTAVIGSLGGSVVNGSFRFTGATCDVSDPDEPDTPEPPPNPLPKEKCIAAGGGMTMCVRNDGKHCYNASSGKQICWGQGETGNKANGPDRQDRGPGNTPPAVPPKAPNGDDLVPNGSPVTTTTTIGSQTITTTTTNSTTVNGTNAGQPSDGSSGGDGDGEEENEGSNSGGDGCDSPPVGQGGDPLLQRMIYQQWKSRCPHGENDLPDPSIAGDQGADEHPTVDSLVQEGGLPGGVGSGGDASGFGLARGCPLESAIPQLIIAGHTVEMPWKLNTCEWLRMLSAMILMAGHIAWALIVVSIGKGS